MGHVLAVNQHVCHLGAILLQPQKSIGLGLGACDADGNCWAYLTAKAEDVCLGDN